MQNVYAQNLIPCPDGTLADPSIGCVATPANVADPSSGLLDITLHFAATLTTFAAAAATLVLIYGAVRYALAAGNKNQIDSAKRVMFWAVFGLAVALLARFVVQFVLNVIA
ncbi:hypothetical protein JXA05_02115 [Candidatus Peregrinibacteria bacterium]|nr:hypothetical protein [Candidatus Peregrinibacteria bacterium]